MTEIHTSSDFNSPPATPTPAPVATDPNRTVRRNLGEDDLQSIYAVLTKGDGALARRRDLGEMHKRLVTMFTTANQGLGEMQASKAAEDRAQIGQRLDQMERAVNSMDGALRIELEPMLRRMVTGAVAAEGKHVRRPSSVPLAVAAFCAGIMIGTAYSSEIWFLSNQALSFSMPESVNISAQPSLNGGSAQTANLMK